ncbi:MAG: hypothetical protein QM775_17155 [Pirellulales bacterium]
MRVTTASEIGIIRLIMRSVKDHGEEEESIGQEGSTINEVLGVSSNDSSPKPSSGGLLASAGIMPLPPTGPSLGDEVAKGVNSFADLIIKMKEAREGGIPDEKKAYKMLLIEGSEAKEVEFSGESRIGQVVGAGGGAAAAASTPALDSRIAPPPGLEQKSDVEEKMF